MATAKLRKVGGSTMLADIPPSILDAMHLSATASVDLSVEEGVLVVQRARAHYTLDQILSECDAAAPISDEDRTWLDAPPVGREL